MTESSAPERPRQVTLAAWLIMGGSAFIVASVFERVASLQSLESQEAIQRFLTEPPGDGLGLDADGVTTILRVLSMVAGGCATAAAILGYQVLQRSKSARVALAILAPPLFVSGMAVGGFLSSVVAASAVMLWLQPARDWFDGVVRRPVAVDAPVAPTPPPPTGPRAFTGFGSRVEAAPGALGAPVVPPPGGPAPAGVHPEVRPGALLTACILTWTFGALAAGVMALSVLAFLAVPDLVLTELERQNPDAATNGLSDSDIRTATFASAAVVILWSGAAVAFALLAFRRVRWARTALLVCAVATALVCLVGSLLNLVLVIPFVAAVVTVALLLRPEVRRWFA